MVWGPYQFKFFRFLGVLRVSKRLSLLFTVTDPKKGEYCYFGAVSFEYIYARPCITIQWDFKDAMFYLLA